jgi:Asp-tRNA(Asn)/Glu-tRNA(Gln) amidotransferase A subunit family amidase
LYGLKTSYSRISAYGGATVDPTLGSYGPIAATADDMTLAYCITAGPDTKDHTTLMQPPISLENYDRTQDLSGLTIGVFPQWARSIVEPAILERLNYIKNQLQRLGARIIEIEIPDIDIATPGNKKKEATVFVFNDI